MPPEARIKPWGFAGTWRPILKPPDIVTGLSGWIVGEIDAAENVEWGVDETLRKQEIRTPDLGGTATTMAFAEAIAAEAVAWEHGPS